MSGYCAFATMSKLELQETSRRGGIASGEARRRKRAAIEREKVQSIALRETRAEADRQHTKSIRILAEAMRFLQEIKQETGGQGACSH